MASQTPYNISADRFVDRIDGTPLRSAVRNVLTTVAALSDSDVLLLARVGASFALGAGIDREVAQSGGSVNRDELVHQLDLWAGRECIRRGF